MHPISTSIRMAAAAFATATATACGLSACGGPPHTATQLSAVSARQACDALQGKTLGGATVDTAVLVDATAASPAYCKVSAAIAPALKLELAIPERWNGKLVYAGGGGFDGSIQNFIWSGPGVLAAGYAIVQGNGGHAGSSLLDASFALDPSQAALFGSGSVPATTAAAKAMLHAAFGTDPQRAYFEGCSNGGREGLMAAQRNPTLFDGIIARAPAYNWTGLMGHFNRNAKAITAPGAGFSGAKLTLLAKAVRDACDANDGVADGIVSNLSACHFDPDSLRCPAGADTGDSCLSDAQLAVVQAWTTPASFGHGAYTSPGWALSGNEDDPAGPTAAGAWPSWLTGSAGNGSDGLQTLFQDGIVKYYLARDPNANSLAYDWDANQDTLLAMATLNDATDADLRPFMHHGGKLILWHGTSDAALTQRATTAYYENMKASMGGQSTVDGFVRYYQAPGVEHCFGGPGADAVNLVEVLDKWVDQGTAPGQPMAAKLNPDGSTALSRPLCPYPQYPRYTGPANDSNAGKLGSNYTCTAP